MPLNRFDTPARRPQISPMVLPYDQMANAIVAADQQYNQVSQGIGLLEDQRVNTFLEPDAKVVRDYHDYVGGIREDLVKTYKGDLRKGEAALMTHAGRVKNRFSGDIGAVLRNVVQKETWMERMRNDPNVSPQRS